MRLFLFNIIIITGLCTFFCCCSLNSESADIAPEEDLVITLPQWPPQDSLKDQYPLLSRWKIQISCADYQQVFYTRDSQIKIKAKKNRPLCLTASPITLLYDNNECSYFKPAGYLYPCNSNISPDSSFTASWEQGYLAQIMQMLFSEGVKNGLSPLENEYMISTFNWEKAETTIENKINSDTQLFYNPWLIPHKGVIEGITSHTFKSSQLNLSASTAVETKMLFPDSQIPDKTLLLLSSFIPENKGLEEKKQFTLLKNTPILIGDANKYGIFINLKSSKNISLELIYLPIYIEDI